MDDRVGDPLVEQFGILKKIRRRTLSSKTDVVSRNNFSYEVDCCGSFLFHRPELNNYRLRFSMAEWGYFRDLLQNDISGKRTDHFFGYGFGLGLLIGRKQPVYPGKLWV